MEPLPWYSVLSGTVLCHCQATGDHVISLAGSAVTVHIPLFCIALPPLPGPISPPASLMLVSSRALPSTCFSISTFSVSPLAAQFHCFNPHLVAYRTQPNSPSSAWESPLKSKIYFPTSLVNKFS